MDFGEHFAMEKENNDVGSPLAPSKQRDGWLLDATNTQRGHSTRWKQLPTKRSPTKGSPRKRMHRRNRFVLTSCGMSCSHPMIHDENLSRHQRNHALCSRDYEVLLNMKTEAGILRNYNRGVFYGVHFQHSDLHLPILEVTG